MAGRLAFQSGRLLAEGALIRAHISQCMFLDIEHLTIQHVHEIPSIVGGDRIQVVVHAVQRVGQIVHQLLDGLFTVC